MPVAIPLGDSLCGIFGALTSTKPSSPTGQPTAGKDTGDRTGGSYGSSPVSVPHNVVVVLLCGMRPQSAPAPERGALALRGKMQLQDPVPLRRYTALTTPYHFLPALTHIVPRLEGPLGT